MTDQLLEPMYRILKAQQANIARIATDLVLPGTTGQGTNIKLWGPAPDIVRLYDTPVRLIEAGALDNWERIVTLSPLEDSDAPGRVIRRNDRNFRYQVTFLTRLTESEQATDHDYASSGGVKDSLLAKKAHKFVYDWHHVFFDDLQLSDADCPILADDQMYRLLWDPGTEYPMALFVAEVTGTRSAW
jgi:hypothetical protein